MSAQLQQSITDALQVPVLVPRAGKPEFSYEEAFCRHRGLISEQEQTRLRTSRVAIIGMGGVGGSHLLTLARLGVGNFTIADPDTFELANFNRQSGANITTLGESKASTMFAQARLINPEIQVRVFSDPIDESNVDSFLDGADIVLDGVDFFSIRTRRLVFRQARRDGLWALTAGPVGFSVAWLSFDPRGWSFDKYFDLSEEMELLDELAAFAIGLTPRATHLRYMDLSKVDIHSGRAPSAGLACQLASGAISAETLKVLLDRKPPCAAPYYSQFDAYRGVMRHGRLWGGNRHPWQRLKRWVLAKRFSNIDMSRFQGGHSR